MKFSPRKEPVIYVVEPYGGSVRRHMPTLPLVYADDAAVTRGDGIFESLLVRGGKAANLQRHAQRFCDSARTMKKPRVSRLRTSAGMRQGMLNAPGLIPAGAPLREGRAPGSWFNPSRKGS